MLWIIGIILLCGGIAYIGDRVGHQVGRKRLSLFGIRPRYTSTIVAVGTGMLIALVVVSGAIIASNSVKNAFFHINALNTRVLQLEAQANEMQKHVRNQQVVLGVGDLVTPEIALLRQNASPEDRYRTLRDFANRVSADANAIYVQRGLRRLVPPADADKKMRDLANSVDLTAELAQYPVLVIAQSDQNQFVNDTLQFNLHFIPDRLTFAAGSPIASLVITAGPLLNIGFIIRTLEENVTSAAISNSMPAYFAQNVQIVSGPTPAELQTTLHGSGRYRYRITASAVDNVYPHTGGVPVAISVAKF